jgi:hypothetical protein
MRRNSGKMPGAMMPPGGAVMTINGTGSHGPVASMRV